MTTKLDKERFKVQQDKAQAILSQLLRDEDNKYCVDCDAKGPRWASWNLGIFLCIRCAGIHRNLGVHISKVKSVNLDSWSPEQISMVMEMGNSRARAVYEAEIPDGFRRPQSDSALESFVRAKYEHKKYIAHEWVPPTPRVPAEFLEDDSDKKKRSRPKPSTGSIQLNSISSRPKPQPTTSTANTNGEVKSSILPAPTVDSTKPAASHETNHSIDLLGLDVPENPSQSAGSNLLDDLLGGTNIPNTAPSLTEADVNQSTTDNDDPPLMDDMSQTKTKESILALYGTGQAPPQFGVPGGMYMAQNAQNMGMYGGVNMMAAPGIPGMQQGMPSQMPNMGMQPMMYNMAGAGMTGQQMMAPMGMYGNSPQIQQQMQYQQLPQQMSGMMLGGGPGVQGQMPMMQGGGGGMMMGQPVGGGMVMGTPGTGQWNNTQSTLSTNLWQ